jgi:hypothetical protein
MNMPPRSVSVALATILLLLLTAVAVFWLGDRGTLVPAPEAVAEGLLKQLSTHRYRQTAQFVSDASRAALGPEPLRTWFEALEHRVGHVHQVEGESARVAGDRADAIVRLDGESARATCEVSLARQRGLWVVTEIRGC